MLRFIGFRERPQYGGLEPYHHENMPNFDPLKPHFYIVKLGFTGVYIIFYFCSKHRLWVLVRTASAAPNIDCEYSLELPRRGGSNEYPQSMFGAE